MKFTEWLWLCLTQANLGYILVMKIHEFLEKKCVYYVVLFCKHKVTRTKWLNLKFVFWCSCEKFMRDHIRRHTASRDERRI